ncbi:MAG: tRNA (adenosine(37)-N6)-dimethylallyltransferase MiaA [bacterium]|nr:tRNA (adenosine(37)-N6)-dimethylallyltransferase MiaA [bacterium]
MSKIIVITGPTASGKSAFAIKLAKKYNGEIICADSRTVYKDLNIGTAKPTKQDQKEIKHYLLDIMTINQNFSVYDFKKAAEIATGQIYSKNRLPIVVGGSGLYIDALLFDYKFRNPRKHPDENLDNKTLNQLTELAKNKYPNEINKIDIKNRRRVEQLLLKGPAKDEDRKKLKRDALIICLNPETALLKQNIATRLDAMLDKGFIQEVEKLRAKFGKENSLLATTGYLRISEYLDKKIDTQTMKKLIIKDSVDLARKQRAWFRRNPHIKWVSSFDQADKLVAQFIKS